MNQGFINYYRCPEDFVDFRSCGDVHNGDNKDTASKPLCNRIGELVVADGSCYLPFDPVVAADELRLEYYVDEANEPGWKKPVRKVYYAVRPLLPVGLRRHLQKAWLKGWDNVPFPRWPVDCSVDRMFETLMRATLEASKAERIPFIWFWPEAKSSCAIMTHDVETDAGLKFCEELMNINDSFAIKSSFQLIPDARYVVNHDVLFAMKSRGFEVNVHDLRHDGHLFDEHEAFLDLAARINEFGEQFGSKGFRAAVLYRKQDWFGGLHFSYDMSVPNVAHLDPQRGGCCTVMPFFVGDMLEIPVTATQDYTLFHILETYSLDLWRQQIDLIMQQHGLISFIVHPDYLNTAIAVETYKALLEYLAKLRRESGVWIALPGEVNTWWRQRSKMTLSSDGEGWRIRGEGAECARVAFASLKDEKIRYEFA